MNEGEFTLHKRYINVESLGCQAEASESQKTDSQDN